MATSAFKSTTRRSGGGGGGEKEESSSSTTLRRSRSLTHFSRRLHPKFVNTIRGSSLDDLALHSFSSPQDTSSDETHNHTARGRSVSRHKNGNNQNPSNPRRRRSLSVATNQITHFQSHGSHANLKELVGWRNPNDGYSSQSSALTDEETRNAHPDKFATVKTIRTVYAQNKGDHPTGDRSGGLYEALRKEVRLAVEQMRTDIEQVCCTSQAVSRTSTTLEEDINQSHSVVKQKYAAELKQSEKRKQDLLAEIILEEQRGRDLSNLVKEIVTDSKNSVSPHKPARTRKRSNDRTRMSGKLVEEAEKYFVDFISNVEDSDISSLDGERSYGSSTLGCQSKTRGGTTYVEAKNLQSPAVPIGTDGIILPWLQWETSNDTFLPKRSIAQTPATPNASKWEAEEEMNFIKDPSCDPVSSRGSSSCDLSNIHQITTKDDGDNISGACKRSPFDMDEYLQLQRKDDFLFEIYKERRGINCGGLFLCAGGLY